MRTRRSSLLLRGLPCVLLTLMLMLCMVIQCGAEDVTFFRFGPAPDEKWAEYGAKETGLVLFKEIGTYTLMGSSMEGMTMEYWGVKDSAGNIILPAKYDDITYIGKGCMIADDTNTTSTVVDLKGKVLFKKEHHQLTYAKDADAFLVCRTDYSGVILEEYLMDGSFKKIPNTSYYEITYLSGKSFKVMNNNGLYGIYTLGKGVVIPVKYKDIEALDWDSRAEGLFQAEGQQRVCGVYDGNGKQILPESYTWFEDYKDGLVIAVKYRRPEYIGRHCNRWNGSDWVEENKEQVIVKGIIAVDDGSVVLPFNYDELSYTDTGDLKTVIYTDRKVSYSKFTWNDGFEKYVPSYSYVKDTAVLSMADVLKNQPKLIDVPAGAWYYDAVQWAGEKGLIDAAARYLKPTENASRSEVVEYLWKSAGCPQPTIENPFTDISAADCCCNAVLWAYEQEITTGTSATTFSPKATCTRSEVVTFLWRAKNRPEATYQNQFTDVAQDLWYTLPIAWAVDDQVTTGTSAETFPPLGPVLGLKF